MIFRIVVPNLNYGSFIETTLNSIAQQSLKGITLRVIIVDGGSTDDSLSIIQHYVDKYSWELYLKPELSQAASIEFGFNLPSECDEIYSWLNSDDLYLRRDVLEHVSHIFKNSINIDTCSLGGYYIDQNGSYLRPIDYAYHPGIRGDVFARNGGFVQPSTFFKSSAFRQSKFNSKNKYIFDADLFYKLKNIGNFYVDQSVYMSGYRLHDSNLSLRIPSARILELSVFFDKTLNKKIASYYLLWVYYIFRQLDRLGRPGQKVKQALRIINNLLSYVTVYKVPSI